MFALRASISWGLLFLVAGFLYPFQEVEERKAHPHQLIRVSPPEMKSPCEVSVAINPTNSKHLVGVCLQGADNFSFASSDGGKSWRSTKNDNPDKRIQGDDAVTFTSDGIAVRSYIAFTGIRVPRPLRASNGIFVRTSKDGLQWSDPAPVIDHVNTVEPFEDKPWPCVDNAKDSPFKGNIYVVWTRFDSYGSKMPEHKTHVYLSKSKDGGKTFSPMERISQTPGNCLDSRQTVMGAMPAIGVKGEINVLWAGPNGLTFVQSVDGGKSFQKEQHLTPTPGAWDFKIKGLSRCNGLPVIKVDHSNGPGRGAIHVNWTDLRNGDPDSFHMVSHDNGKTWSAPNRVNNDAKGNGKDQFFTSMAVDPLDGSVNIAFFDRRNSQDTKTGVTLARSTDSGKSFVNYKVNQDLFDCNMGPFFGDYLGIDALGGKVVTMYQHHTSPRTLAISAALFDFDNPK